MLIEMNDERKERRAQAKMAVDTIKDLLEMGVVPRSVSVGDVTIDVASYTPQTSATATASVSTEVIAPPRHRGHLDRLADRIAARTTARVSS